VEIRNAIHDKIQIIRVIIRNKKGLIVPLSILLLLLSTGLVYYTIELRRPDALPALPVEPAIGNERRENAFVADDAVEVLPQIERQEEEATVRPPDPFAAPPILVGVLMGGVGENIAIIEAGGNTYVATEGNMVAGLWKVQEIQRDKAIIILRDRETVLYLGR